jgi:hypothetical protein
MANAKHSAHRFTEGDDAMNSLNRLSVLAMLVFASASLATSAVVADPNISKQERIQSYRDQGYGSARINALERQREKNLQRSIAKRRAKAKARERARVRAINRLRKSVKRRPIRNFELRRSRRTAGQNRFRSVRRHRPTMRRFGGFRGRMSSGRRR